MSASDPSTVSAQATALCPAAPGVFLPLLLWLVLQLLCLAASLGHLRLWANTPRDFDQLALPQLLIVQSVFSSLLFPILFRTPVTSLLVIASVWPFCQIAAFVSSAPAGQWIAAAAMVSGWMIALAIWRALLRTPLLERIGVALAAALALGAPLLLYLSAEFSVGPTYDIPWSFAACFGPTLSSLAALQPDVSLLAGWIVMIAHLLLASAILFVASFITRRRTPHIIPSAPTNSPNPSH